MLHRKVLIAEDDAEIRHLVAHWLTAAGYEVRQARDGREALEAAYQDCPHFLITDWDMPGLDGIELCRRIRGEGFPHYIYTVLLTAHNKVADMILALETGADDLLTKPIAAPELLARLHAGARVIELENQLVRLARTDPLTGIPNRWVFFEHFDRELARSRRYGAPLSCVLCDLDFFKTINDLHGHIVGDSILKAFAQMLSAQCRTSDHLCRFGGEEFCILLTDTNEEVAANWAERIRAELHNVAFAPGKPLTITASFGVAQLSEEITDPTALLDRADRALRLAKHSGRDRVSRFSALRDCNTEASFLADGCNEQLRGILARDIMTSPIVCLNQNQPISDAADLLLKMQRGAVPLVDDDGRLVGIVSEKDLIAARPRTEDWHVPLREVMKTRVVSFDEEVPAIVIYGFLFRVSIRRVVIVKDGRPTGFISRGTLFRWLVNWQSAEERDPARSGRPPYESLTVANRHVRRMIDALADRAADLRNYLDANADDVTPAVVAYAIAIQEMAIDLVNFSRRVQEAPRLGEQAAYPSAAKAVATQLAEAPLAIAPAVLPAS